jgi:hypothetical protein
LRIGSDNEVWANEIPDVATAIMRGRMSGWVRVTTEVYSDDALRQKLIDAAVQFTGSLPKLSLLGVVVSRERCGFPTIFSGW